MKECIGRQTQEIFSNMNYSLLLRKYLLGFSANTFFHSFLVCLMRIGFSLSLILLAMPSQYASKARKFFVDNF